MKQIKKVGAGADSGCRTKSQGSQHSAMARELAEHQDMPNATIEEKKVAAAKHRKASGGLKKKGKDRSK